MRAAGPGRSQVCYQEEGSGLTNAQVFAFAVSSKEDERVLITVHFFLRKGTAY